jgi:nitrogen fixation/metabolism regulation signal transduction histidine kinase
MAQTAQAAAPANQQGKPAYRRSWKNYLLNLRYQLRYTLTIVGISLVLTGGLGYVVMSKAREASRIVNVRAMDPTDDTAQQLAAQFAHNDKVMMLVLIAFALLLVIVLTAYGIVITHKVAGPLYKVSLHLDKIRDGKLGVVYPLRKGDELADFFEHFKTAHDALRERTQEDIALLDRAAAQTSGPLADELRAAKQKKEDSLK